MYCVGIISFGEGFFSKILRFFSYVNVSMKWMLCIGEGAVGFKTIRCIIRSFGRNGELKETVEWLISFPKQK